MNPISAEHMISKENIQSIEPHQTQPYLFNAVATQAIYAIDLVKQRDGLIEVLKALDLMVHNIDNSYIRMEFHNLIEKAIPKEK
jgi:hypothetical protein